MNSANGRPYGYRICVSKRADRIAAALDREELSAFLLKLVTGNQYRLFLLSFARFATESDIKKLLSEIRAKLRGKAKDRYFAENACEALYLSDTAAAMEFIEKSGNLEAYAVMRGMSTQEIRDTMMIPKFGFDADGVKRYDIGGKTIEFSVTPDLKFSLYDCEAKKTIRSFPKKGDDSEKLAKCVAEFDEFKKSVADFIKQRTEQLKGLYMSGDKVLASVWHKVYVSHPVLKHLTQSLIWKDETNTTFITSDGAVTDISGNAYAPQGDICLAHVLDMTQQEICAWRNYLAANQKKLLFEQVWEPVISINDKDIPKRYDGVVLTNKERNELKRILASKGIVVKADAQKGNFNYRAGKYEFNSENDMSLGLSMRLHYTVDEATKSITLGKLSKQRNSSARELNAIIYALDIVVINNSIVNDRDSALTDDTLRNFSAAQIVGFIKVSAENNSAKCTALLLEYKNEHFPEFSTMDEFTLE